MLDKRKVAALSAEFLGTFVLASAVLAMVAHSSFAFFPALVAGLVLMIMVFVFGPVSGSHINPAVTVALWSQRKIQSMEAVAYIVVQLLGGLAAWALAQWLLNTDIMAEVTSDIDGRIFVAEAIGAFVFATGIAAAVQRGYEGSRQAVAIGFSLTIGILVASLGSAGILNPAVAVALHSYSTAYIVGPIVGAVLGMAVYNYLFVETKGKKKR